MNLKKMAGALVCALVIAAQSAVAQVRDRFDLDLQDADLVVAVQMLTNRTGLQFVIADDAKSFRPVTLTLRDVEPEKAIAMLAEAAGGFAERNDAGVWIIRSGKPERPAVAPVPTVRQPRITTKIRVRIGDPVHVYRQLTNSVQFDDAGGLREVPLFESGRRVSNSTPTTFVTGGVTQISDVQPLDPSNERTPVQSENARQLQPGGGGGFGAGGGGGFPGGGGAGAPGAGGGQTTLTPGTGLVPDGITYLSYDPTDNSIVVQGSDEAIRELQQIISLFDVAPRQVEIKVEFITTSQSATRSFGMDWSFSRGAVFIGNRPGTFAATGDPVFVNYSTGNLVTRLRTQLLEGDGKVVTAPIIRTFNNQPASIFSTTQTTFFISNIINAAGGIQRTFQPQSFTVNTGLSVRPRINDDGTVTMTLNPQVSDLGQVRRGPDGQEVPDILSQVIQVATRVRDGETIVLGGLTRKSTRNTVNRFPILSDLPVIGSLFRSTFTERNDSELLIFVTPRIIRDDAEAGFTP